MSMTRQNFATQSDDGSAWKPLSEAYAKRKKGPQILVEDGHLRRSLLGRTAHSIWKVAKKRLVWGTRDPKAKYHNHYNVGGRMPSRPFMPRVAKLVKPITRQIRDRIVGTTSNKTRAR